MQVFRIAGTQHINDLSGTGARINGGRWNHKGTGIIYSSENRSLATVEFLVHVPLPILPSNLSVACIEIPDSIVPMEISGSELPSNWRSYPALPVLADLGTNWAVSKESLLLRVPSAITANEFNILINPSHDDMKQVNILKVERFKIDKRLFK
jgi:RES domain-containing protein